MLKALSGVWSYRGFVLGSVKREFQNKYRNSLLGAVWNIINPLAMIVVYTVIFSQIMRARLPGVDNTFGYSIYLCSGVLTWGLFTEVTTRSQGMFLDNANLLKKMNFPRLCLPMVVVINGLLNFAIVFGLFTVFLIFSGSFPGMAFLALIPLLALLLIFSVGLGMVLGVLNVFFRDVGHFFGIFVTFWFWLTPIVYSQDILPEKVRSLMAFNPMGNFMMAVQGVLVRGEWPRWSGLIYLATCAIAMCLLGLHLFRSRIDEMVDEL